MSDETPTTPVKPAGPPTPAPDADRRVLGGRYEVGDLLGRGGMAVVHQGRDTRLGRRVAIKMLRPDLARDPAFQARFRREAQSAAALNHPSIVAVYDTGEESAPGVTGTTERVPFIVMEYVPGRTLREVLHADERDGDGVATTGGTKVPAESAEGGRHRRPTPAGGVPQTTEPAPLPTPLGVEQSVRIVIGVLSALAYSHRAGIVHRDIKPANVMLTSAGGVKVMDFGIARAMADAAATMTQTQAVIGTAQYLSPEQARGETVDARSDLYSTGCLLYELLTGRPPFIGDSPVSVAYQHVREEPLPPSTFNDEVPAALDQVVMHALAKDREARYPDADAFRADLQAAVAGRPVSPVPAPAATTAMPVVDDAATRPIRRAPVVPPPLVTMEAPEPEEEPDRRGRAAGWVALVLAVLAVLGLGGFLASQLLGDDEPTQVPTPAVAGLTREQAKAEIEAAGLTYAEGTAVNDDTVPEGSVVSQDPEAEALIDPTGTVTVVVSLGVGEVAVPEVTGMSQADARAAITGAGLTVGNVTSEDSPDVPQDAVIRTDPPSQSNVPEGTEVNLVVSTGEVTVPNLAGQEYTAVRTTLANDYGLDSEIVFEESAEVAPNLVIRQDPVPGSVPQGSVVTLVVAQAPAPTQTPSPTDTPTTTPPPTSTPPPTPTP